MVAFIAGAFVVLHGLVHLLYAGQSLRLFELQAGMTWPVDSWLFGRFLGDGSTKRLVATVCGLAAAGFVAGGAAFLFREDWWRPLVVGSALFSSGLYVLSWDGKFEDLDGSGAIAIVINLAIVGSVLVLHWPER